MPRLRNAVATILALACAPTLVVAQLDDLYVRGFVSQGYINSTFNNYLISDSEDDTFEFHEAAVSIQANPEDRLRVGIQFFARDFGDQGNNDVIIDWAFADYQWRDDLGFRLGKLKAVQGLYGQGRDIDILRPTVLLPQSVYNEGMREVILGVEGGGLYGNIPVGDVGELDYELYGGTLNVPNPEVGVWFDYFLGAGEELAAIRRNSLPAGSEVTFEGVIRPRVRFDSVYGGSLFWHCPVSGLRFGFSSMSGRFDMRSRMQFTTVDPEGNSVYSDEEFDYEGTLNRAMTLSGEWSRDALTVAAEYYQERVNNVTAEGFYGWVTVQASERFALSGYASRYLRDREDPDGDMMTALGYPDYVGWQNDYCLALRHDPLDHLVLKFEFHRIDGLGLLSPYQNEVVDDDDEYKRWWSFMAAKATVHF